MPMLDTIGCKLLFCRDIVDGPINLTQIHVVYVCNQTQNNVPAELRLC
jgi:hypothetical protein